MNNKVKFLRGTSDEYAVAEKDNDTIYFTTDDGKLYIGDKEISGSDVTIDTTLSDTSTNPVQNKVIKQAIDNKADKTVATTSADGLMSAEDKSKLDSADNTYALKSKYGDTTINVGRKAGTAGGIRSTAEGYNTTASGDYSHAEGYLCTASSGNSHAEGNNTTASGTHSHSEGDNTIASGIGSHAGGASSIASSDYSFAHGMHVESNNSCEVSLGKFNKSSSDTLFSVGDGTSDTSRHNAFEITKTGGKLHDKDIATADGFIKVNSSDAYDCNTLYDAGLYLCNGSATNTPNNLVYGTLLVMPYRKPYGNAGPDYCAQIYIPNGDASDTSMWYRTSLQNTWNEWKRSCDGGNADTLDGKHANEIATNPNLLINPDFKINQRNLTGLAVDHNDDGTPNTATQKYVMDRWRIMDGTITIADEKVRLSGTIIQVLENSIGSNFTATVSVESGTATASYNDSTKTFTIVGNSAVLNWAKLEYGSVATPFIPPDPILELIKCRRFYYKERNFSARFLTGYCVDPGTADVTFPLFMRTNPTVDYKGLVVMCKDREKPNDTESRGYSISSARGLLCNFGIHIVFKVDTSSAQMSAGCAVTLQGTTPAEYGGYFALDAEIY